MGVRYISSFFFFVFFSLNIFIYVKYTKQFLSNIYEMKQIKIDTPVEKSEYCILVDDKYKSMQTFTDGNSF